MPLVLRLTLLTSTSSSKGPYFLASYLMSRSCSELSRFIASGRLHATIDRVHGVVETNRPALKNAQTETVIRKGDVLLNSIQRLSKVLY